MPAPEPTVFVVDDDAAVRDALRLLARSVGLRAETFDSAQGFLLAYEPDCLGCLVLDVRMPGMSGLELQEQLAERGATIPIVFVTAHGDVPMAVQAMRAGAVDFLQKPFRDQDLIDKIQAAIARHRRLLSMAEDADAVRTRLDTLTPREREVMAMVVQGKANKVIAIDLGISKRTVEIHRARVMEKMEAQSLSHLVQMAMGTGGSPASDPSSDAGA
jgi:FixJ family two-component response regulator